MTTNNSINNTLVIQGATFAIAAGTMAISDITGMFATPKQLIAAPGSGLGIVVLNMYADYVYDGSHSLTNGGTIDVTYGSVPHGGSNSAINGNGVGNFVEVAFLTAAGSRVAYATGINSTNEQVASNNANKGIFITNESAAFTANSSTATINWAISYLIVPML